MYISDNFPVLTLVSTYVDIRTSRNLPLLMWGRFHHGVSFSVIIAQRKCYNWIFVIFNISFDGFKTPGVDFDPGNFRVVKS